MTREQKLEAVLRQAKAVLENWESLIEGEFCKGLDDVYTTDWKLSEDAKDAINAALATPPTSEWNEAIEAAASACREHLGGGIDYSIDGAKCVEIIESLKRKERP